jgi:F-type H+-transporting ATPase subunit b
MDLLIPQLGLFFWTLLIFLAVFFVLRRFAWKPILQAIHEREHKIESSLQEAALAREEMSRLKSDNEALIREARAEREQILKEAQNAREEIIRLARSEAAEAGAKEREKASQLIEAEKSAALAHIREVAAALAVEVAERILRKNLDNKAEQEAYARQLISDLQQN